MPLFVILTGYLMFNRSYEDPNYLKKYISRNLIPLVVTYEVWNIVWNLLRYTHVADEPQSWKMIAKAAFFMGDTVSALWYLPMTIALYLGMPLLSIAYHRLQLFNYKKILLVALIASGTVIPSIPECIQALGRSSDIHPVLKMNIFGASVWGESVWMIYLLAGYAIYKGAFKKISTAKLIGVGVFLPIIIMYAIEYSSRTVQHYDFILVVLLSISVFELIIRWNPAGGNHTFQRMIEHISKFSFSVYMLHVFIGGAIFKLMQWQGALMANDSFGYKLLNIIYFAIFMGCIILITQVIVFILKKNTWIRRYVLLMK